MLLLCAAEVDDWRQYSRKIACLIWVNTTLVLRAFSVCVLPAAEEIEQSRSRDRLDKMGATFSMPRQPRAATSSSQNPAAAPAGAVPSQATSAFAALNQASSVAERPPVSGGSRREAAPAAAAPSSEVDKFSFEDADATVETLLLMEYADLGTLDQLMLQGRLKSDKVRLLSSPLYKSHTVSCSSEILPFAPEYLRNISSPSFLPCLLSGFLFPAILNGGSGCGLTGKGYLTVQIC